MKILLKNSLKKTLSFVFKIFFNKKYNIQSLIVIDDSLEITTTNQHVELFLVSKTQNDKWYSKSLVFG
jgi:hypothetical protein